jgi:endogenous inhibitor of DNA gyrase (YacG/DUF329 family)
VTTASGKVPCSACGKPVSASQAAKTGGLCILCSIKLEEKVACQECGKQVSAKLAARRNGLCLHCSAKRNPFFVLYSSLIDRVCHSSGGFDLLSDAEKLYYALTLFQNEVNNGGFHQFFFNSSGSYYELIEDALITLDEAQTLELLRQAKRNIFPEIPVPINTAERRSTMQGSTSDLMTKLDELDQQFYRIPDTLTPKLEDFARQRGLVPANAGRP